MSDDKDLTTFNHDQQLAADIKAGNITQAEVDAIWKATWDMSAQTPITVRRAVAAMREAAVGKTPEQAMALMFPMLADFLMTAATETQAALTRDESKFAHLVAGTEAIVKTLQNINPLERRLERIEAIIDGLGELIERRFAELKGGDAHETRTLRSSVATGEVEPESASPEEATPDPEQEANEARRKTIGSAWAKNQ